MPLSLFVKLFFVWGQDTLAPIEIRWAYLHYYEVKGSECFWSPDGEAKQFATSFTAATSQNKRSVYS